MKYFETKNIRNTKSKNIYIYIYIYIYVYIYINKQNVMHLYCFKGLRVTNNNSIEKKIDTKTNLYLNCFD